MLSGFWFQQSLASLVDIVSKGGGWDERDRRLIIWHFEELLKQRYKEYIGVVEVSPARDFKYGMNALSMRSFTSSRTSPAVQIVKTTAGRKQSRKSLARAGYKAVILLSVRPVSLTHKKLQRRKIICGMHPVGRSR